ncbi:hypothetical protein EII38_03940 [Streptococcus minor]|uniref:Uncharacterized protein n=1 Tax=Streptococcus minor TaxID=229549 RepID=A0A3P1VCM2_9STRE|nr:hypothetical protein [Streptococcus minor]MDO5078605.1 hypothetical protein [Streptococcus minor]RRD31911.1 hypothetical protein EII38_03940 [Streptococcus minor]
MVDERQKRLIELYEKGILTKEEAKACFMELEEEPDFLFVEEKTRLSFSLPSLKIFSSSKLKQDFRFSAVESMNINLSEGKIIFQKGKEPDIYFVISYPQLPQDKVLPQIYVENKSLHFSSTLPCYITVSLPDCWMSVLDLGLGQADARLDFLPFEDVSIHSHSDKKQQDIRVTPCRTFTQHLHLELRQAPIHLVMSKEQGLKGRFESSQGQLVINRKKQTSPYICEKSGDKVVYLQVQTQASPVTLKGIKDVRIL